LLPIEEDSPIAVVHLSPWIWAALAVAAFGQGLSKTGIAGISILSVAAFAFFLPSRMSVGVVLPILICCDLVAVLAYRRHGVWRHLFKLFPWAAAGVVAGYFVLRACGNADLSRLIGIILIALVVVQWWRRRQANEKNSGSGDIPHSAAFVAIMGVAAGFTTMVANAAGPIMVIYFLASRLDKMEFMGTGAWFFMILNWFKVPFSASLGLVSLKSLPYDLWLAPCGMAGALFGRWLIRYVNQSLFESSALALTLLASIRLIFE
jgi:uncharacterized membrane protein YfcA